MRTCPHGHKDDPEHYCFRLNAYFMKKLASFGCPDSYLDHTATTMTKRAIGIVEDGE